MCLNTDLRGISHLPVNQVLSSSLDKYTFMTTWTAGFKLESSYPSCPCALLQTASLCTWWSGPPLGERTLGDGPRTFVWSGRWGPCERLASWTWHGWRAVSGALWAWCPASCPAYSAQRGRGVEMAGVDGADEVLRGRDQVPQACEPWDVPNCDVRNALL